MPPAPLLVARQPICDAQRRVLAYELLFRRAADVDQADVTDHARATARVLLAAFADVGREALVGARQAWVNVTREFLLGLETLPFGPEGVVLELLEDQLVDAALLERLAQLRREGYAIALDDFVADADTRALLAHADYVKLEVGGLDDAELDARLAELDGFEGELLAEKIETYAEFVRCRRRGFSLFQGWFLFRPEVVAGTVPPASQAALSGAARYLDDRIGFEELQRRITEDPGMAVRLLRLLNSAAVPLARRVSSVREGVVILGERTVRQWAVIVSLAGVPTASGELLPTGLIRARVLERLAAARGDDTGAAFLVGLLSIADALAGARLEDVLAGLPLDDAPVAALLHHEGPDGHALGALLRHERGELGASLRAGVPPTVFAEALMAGFAFAQASASQLALAA